MMSRTTDAPVPLGEFVPEAENDEYVERDSRSAVVPVSAAVAELRETLHAAR